VNESVLSIPLPRPQPAKATTRPKSRRNGKALQWYLLLALMITFGWLISDHKFVTPEEGIGYWLGIAGGSMMVLLLMYPLRKRFRILHVLGATKHWFRLHMVFGLLGPLLIMYHSNFNLGSFNSSVAFYAMLLVAGSGIVGRHFYAGIHRGLYGRKTNLRELQADLAGAIEKSHGLAKIMPRLVQRLDALTAELQDDAVRHTIGIRRSLKWTFTHSIMRVSLLLTARRELRAAAIAFPAVARDRKKISRAAAHYIREFTVLSGRVAQFSLYERLFALWHVLHLPIFFLMVLSAIVHVVAVHMY
jgi:hypothetical protein